MTNSSTLTSVATCLASASVPSTPTSAIAQSVIIPTVAAGTTSLPYIFLRYGDKGNIIQVPMNQAQVHCLGMENQNLIGQPQVQAQVHCLGLENQNLIGQSQVQAQVHCLGMENQNLIGQPQVQAQVHCLDMENQNLIGQPQVLAPLPSMQTILPQVTTALPPIHTVKTAHVLPNISQQAQMQKPITNLLNVVPDTPQQAQMQKPITKPAHTVPNTSQQALMQKPTVKAQQVVVPFSDPRDIAVGESLMKLLQPKNSPVTTRLANGNRINDVSSVSVPVTNVSNVRFVKLPSSVNIRPRQASVYSRMIPVVQPAVQLNKEIIRPAANLSRVNIQVPAFRPFKAPAKTITTPSYTNLPRMCPAKVPSPQIRPNVVTYASYPEYMLQRQQLTSASVASNNRLQFNPLIVHRKPQIHLVSQYVTTKTTPEVINSTPEESCSMPRLRQLLVDETRKSKDIIEDPIGLLVPEVEIVENENEEVIIPQWSPERNNLKRKRKNTNIKNGSKKSKLSNPVEVKEGKIILDKLNINLIKNGRINLRKIKKANLFLPRKKVKLEEKITEKSTDSVTIIEELTLPKNNDSLNMEATATVKVENPQNVEKKMRCLVYKSCNFTHVIPLQDVISIPNELLEDLEQSNPSSACQQLEMLLSLVSEASDGDDVEPEFEAMDLNTISTVSLNSDLLGKLSNRYKKSYSANDLKVQKLREKLMTALANNDKTV